MSSTEGNPPRKVVIFGKEGLSDMSLVVGNKEFKVQKMVLAVKSDYFETLFFGNFKESSQDRIELEADPTAFERMLKFIYDGNFGNEDFLRCPSRLADTTKNYGVENYHLLEVLDRFDVKQASIRFWKVADKWRCLVKKKGIWISDYEHCMNLPLICAINNGYPSDIQYTGRAVKAWMQKFSSLVPQAVHTNEDALPKIIKEMVI